jgi:hypothetical protein
MRIGARAALVIVAALGVAVGCAQAPVAEGETEKPELSAELKSLVLDEAPTDIQHPLYIDFNGRAELVGYALDPSGLASPGSTLALKLYWRSTGKLEQGYVPYTELLLPDGTRIDVEGSGPVRKGELVPSNWELGKVYVDELSLTVPKDIAASRFSIVVGLKTAPLPEEPAAEPEQPADKKAARIAPKKVDPTSVGTFGPIYLSVLSGPADGKHGGVIAALETGVTAAALRARAKGDKRDAAGTLKRPPTKPTPAALAAPAKPAVVKPAPAAP